MIHTLQSVHIYSRFASNSEAFASELLGNPEDMFHRYYIHSDKFSTFQSDPHNSVLPFAKGLSPNVEFIFSNPRN